MREREFWELLEEVFGRGYGRALAHDQQLTKLGGRTVVEALGDGAEPRVVERAVRPDGGAGHAAVGEGPCRSATSGRLPLTV